MRIYIYIFYFLIDDARLKWRCGFFLISKFISIQSNESVVWKIILQTISTKKCLWDTWFRIWPPDQISFIKYSEFFQHDRHLTYFLRYKFGEHKSYEVSFSFSWSVLTLAFFSFHENNVNIILHIKRRARLCLYIIIVF